VYVPGALGVMVVALAATVVAIPLPATGEADQAHVKEAVTLVPTEPPKMKFGRVVPLAENIAKLGPLHTSRGPVPLSLN